jgi:hypothetical protein
MRQKKTTLSKQRKTIPLPATDRTSGRDRIDSGRYYRCWNCGFICDVDLNALSEQGNGSYPEAYTDAASETGAYGGYGSPIITIDGDTLPKSDADGNPVTVVHKFEAGGTGCPLCFTRSWKK